MTAVKTVVAGVLAWVAVGALARADAITGSSGLSSWTSWSSGGGAVSTDPSAAPAPTPTPPPVNPPAVASAPAQPAASPAPTSGVYDASINFGSGPYPDAAALLTGSPQPWYVSPSVQHVFGGTPSAQQQADFTQQVLQDVEKSYALAGLSPSITLNSPANHTVSVVSGASYGPNGNAIGITDVGANGFGLIDKLSYANSVSDLAWAVAHNVSHELMHAFGIAVHHDQTGSYIDAATANWSLLTDPQATFSPAAAQDIVAHNFGRSFGNLSASGTQLIDGDQEILAQPVPEPTTLGFWGMAGAAALLVQRRRALRAVA
jgi:hypothetical protein